MKIVVLVKQVPDTSDDRSLDLTTGWVDRDASEAIVEEVTERALEVALQYKDAHKDTEVVVMSMGPASTTTALRTCLSMGADSAVHILDDALRGADLSRTAAALAAALRQTGFDLVVAGNESTDGRGGVIPVMVAEHLGLPALSSLLNASIGASSVSGERAAESGTTAVHAALPAVISVTESVAEARFPNFKGIMRAKKKPLAVLSLADIGVESASAFAAVGTTRVLSVAERPARTGGTKIVDTGTAGLELAEFLVAGRLL